jgi:hypothetical protein
MTDRIRLLVKRIAETRPVQSQRRQELLDELRALRGQIDARSAPDQLHSLDAALLLLEFMSRSEDVATAETIQIVASLVSTIDESLVRNAHQEKVPPATVSRDVSEHADLRLTEGFLLGTILLQAGVISPESLGRALQLHTSSHQALGQCLVQLGAVTPEQIKSAVAYQDRLRENQRTPRREARPAPQRTELNLSPKQHSFMQSMQGQVLGEVLIRLGSVSREQLARALQVQRAANIHVGEALVETGAATWDQIKKGLEVQRKLRRNAA